MPTEFVSAERVDQSHGLNGNGLECFYKPTLNIVGKSDNSQTAKALRDT